MRKLILIITAFLLAISCNQKKEPKHKESNKPIIGKYVYIDKAMVIHSQNGCKAVFKDHNMQQVNPVEPECLSFENLSKVCSQCITEQMIDSLNTLFSKYRQSYINVGNLHEYLNSNYDGIPSELQFRKNLRNPEMTRRLYQIMLEKKEDVGSYEEFTEWIGLTKPAKRKTKTQL